MKKTIGKQLPAPNKLRSSDVIAIPLGDNCWGYGRILNGAAMSILDVVSIGRKCLDSVTKANVAFFVEFYEPYDVSPWIYLGKWPFTSEDESWGPATYIQDKIDPTIFRVLQRGKMTNCTESEVRGLHRHGLLPPEKIKQKILSNFKIFNRLD